MKPYRQNHYLAFHAALIALLCMLAGITGGGIARASVARTIHSTGAGGIPVLTYKFDNQRTGANTHEVKLNDQNVNTHQFGQLISYPVDGQIYAQPLYVPQVRVHGHLANLVIAATEHDSIYAFDADRTDGNTRPLWHTSYLTKGTRAVSTRDVNCRDVSSDIGITSTPVIDINSQTLYVVDFVNTRGTLIYELHAIDLTNGQDKVGSPAEVHAPHDFDPRHERQRAGLLLLNGHIYIAFGSFCDNPPYHGLIISYKYYQHKFHRLATYNVTAQADGGVWGSGGGIAADRHGYIYATSGNGSFDLDHHGHNASDSMVKLTESLDMVDYFTPFDQQCLKDSDGDLGSGGPLLTKDDKLISGGKDGRLYVVNIHHMGHYHSVNHPCRHLKKTDLDEIAQELPPRFGSGIFSTPAYWNGYIFVSNSGDHTRAYRYTGGHLSGPTSQTPERFIFSGGNPVISSNGNQPGTGVLWVIDHKGFLRAYEATNLNHELISANIGSAVKLTAPIVDDGKVFVPTSRSLKIFGLRAENMPTGFTYPRASNTSPSAPNSQPPTPVGINNSHSPLAAPRQQPGHSSAIRQTRYHASAVNVAHLTSPWPLTAS